MKSPFRSIGRILFLLLVLVLLVIGGVLAWFSSWRADKQASLEGGSEILKTLYGPVEFVVRGEGPAVLIFHGAPGGYDQALHFGAPLLDAGFMVIAPSRPGYLRTPLSSGLLPSQQADLFSALLDNLGERDAAVIGISGGAPAAIEFAFRHPKRVWALAILGGVTKTLNSGLLKEHPQPGMVVLNSLTGDIGAWMAVELSLHNTRQMLNNALETEDVGDATSRYLIVNDVMKDPAQIAWFQGLIDSFAPLGPREAGARNDTLNQLALPEYPFEKIATPTLFIHGEKDKGLPIADAQAAAKRIPGAQFIGVDGVGQLVFLGPKGPEAQQSLIEFLKQHVPSQEQP
jgi:pimeloyl-ACP methyl ester carboxylesterase